MCGLLSLYEQLYRVPAAYLTKPPLLLSGPDAGLDEHLGLVDDRLVSDVAALTLLFTESQPDLAVRHQHVVSNPIFDRSNDLGGADADVIVDSTLLELKTVKTPVLNKITVWQILGYLLADTTDRHEIREVGWYFSRHGYLWRLPVDELLARLHGGTLDLTSARAQFADILHGSLLATIDEFDALWPSLYRVHRRAGSFLLRGGVAAGSLQEPSAPLRTDALVEAPMHRHHRRHLEQL